MEFLFLKKDFKSIILSRNKSVTAALLFFNCFVMPSSELSTTNVLFTVGNIDCNTVSLVSTTLQTISIPATLLGGEITVGDCVMLQLTRDSNEKDNLFNTFRALQQTLSEKYISQLNSLNEVNIIKIAHDFVLIEVGKEIYHKLHDYPHLTSTTQSVFLNGVAASYVKLDGKYVKIYGLTRTTKYDLVFHLDGGERSRIVEFVTPHDLDYGCLLVFVEKDGPHFEEVCELLMTLNIAYSVDLSSFVTHAFIPQHTFGNRNEMVQQLELMKIPVVSIDWFANLQSNNLQNQE